MAAAGQALANLPRGGGGFWILSAGDLAQRRFAGYAKHFPIGPDAVQGHRPA